MHKSPLAAKPVDALIMGCGVSGLTAARELAERGDSVVVLEDYQTPGGNHISKQIGSYSFDIGAIFFWSTSPMFDLFPEATKNWMPIDLPIGRITPGRAIHRYPIDLRAEVLSLPPSRQIQIAADALYHRLFHRRRASVRDFALQRMGRRIFEDSGLELYIERFYGRPADDIVYSFAERRMRWIKNKTSPTAILAERMRALRSRLGPPEPPLQCYARPRDGFPSMYQPVVERLEKRGVQFVFDAGLSTVEAVSGGFEVSGRTGRYRGARLLNTIPLAVAGRLAGLTDIEPPQSCSLVTLFCRFKGARRFTSTVLYNFNRIGAWKRLTMHSDYYGKDDGWEYFSAECNVPDGASSPDRLFADFRSSTNDLGVFDGTLELVGSIETDFAYPVLDATSVARRDRLMSALGSMGIEGFGRQGAFDYIASSDLAIDLAHKALKKKLS